MFWLLRKLVKLAITLLVLGLIVTALAWFFIDRVAKTAVEKGAGMALGVPTSTDSVNISLLYGGAEIHNLRVANPAGFSAPHFLRLNSGKVAVNLSSLRQPVVEIPEFRLEGITLAVEKTAKGSNYEVILKNLEKFKPGTGGDPAPDTETKSHGQKFIVKVLVIRDVAVDVQADLAGGAPVSAQVRLDEPVEMKEIGAAEGGISMAELTNRIMQGLLAAVLRQGGDRLPVAMRSELTAGLQSLGRISEVGVGAIEGWRDTVNRTGSEVKQKMEDVLGETQKLKEQGGKLLEGLIPGQKPKPAPQD